MNLLATMFNSVGESYAMCQTVSQYVELTALLALMTTMTLAFFTVIGAALVHAPLFALVMLGCTYAAMYHTLKENGYYND